MRAVFLVLFSLCVVPPLWGASVDQSAPFFSLKELRNGSAIDLSDYRGKVVYLDFWASWCVPCRESFPVLSDLYEKYQNQGFEVIAVNLDENPDAAREFIERYPADYALAMGFGSEVPTVYEVVVMPTAYLIDAEGVIRLVHHGFKLEHVDFLEAVLEKLLAER